MVVGIRVKVFFFGMFSEVVGLVVDMVMLMLMFVWVVVIVSEVVVRMVSFLKVIVLFFEVMSYLRMFGWFLIY